MNAHNFNRGALINRPLKALTVDQLRQLVPSAFQTKAHHSRSARYAFVDTAQVIEGVMLAGFVPTQAVQSRSRVEDKQDYTKHMIRFAHKDSMNDLKVGDSVPQVVMINAHDGSSVYDLEAGLFKLLCSNGLFASGQDFQRVKVYHKGNIVNEVVDGSYRVIEDATKALGVSQQWGQLMLTDGDQKALAMAAHNLRFADAEGKVTTPITPKQLLQARRAEDGMHVLEGEYLPSWSYGFAKPDLWTTFNVVQENVIKGGLHGVRNPQTRERRRVTTRQVNGIDQDARLNRALWILAEQLAASK